MPQLARPNTVQPLSWWVGVEYLCDSRTLSRAPGEPTLALHRCAVIERDRTTPLDLPPSTALASPCTALASALLRTCSPAHNVHKPAHVVSVLVALRLAHMQKLARPVNKQVRGGPHAEGCVEAVIQRVAQKAEASGVEAQLAGAPSGVRSALAQRFGPRLLI